MKGMRTPFITTMGENYNDPDVQPVAVSFAGPIDPGMSGGFSSSRGMKSSQDFHEPPQKHVYEARSKSVRRKPPVNSKIAQTKERPNLLFTS